VRPKFSEVTGTKEVAGQTIPTLSSTEMCTRMEMNAGQTAVLRGLVTKKGQPQLRSRVVWDGDGTGREVVVEEQIAAGDEIETVVVIRPEIVEPLNPNEAKLKFQLPTCEEEQLPSAITPVLAWRPVRPTMLKGASVPHHVLPATCLSTLEVQCDCAPCGSVEQALYVPSLNSFDELKIPAPFVPEPVQIEMGSFFKLP
jgi:hypothetical protein